MDCLLGLAYGRKSTRLQLQPYRQHGIQAAWPFDPQGRTGVAGHAL